MGKRGFIATNVRIAILIVATVTLDVRTTSAEYQFARTVNAQGAGNSVWHPLNLTSDAAGNIWAAGNSRVQQFSNNGTFISQFTGRFITPAFFDSLDVPTDVAIDAAHNVWVVDNPNRLMQFDSNGNFMSELPISVRGDDAEPIGMAIDAGGTLWVTDSNNLVNEYNPWGDLIFQFGGTGTGNGQFSEAYDIAVDAQGHLWVSDFTNNRIQEFTSTGVYLGQIGAPGSGNGQFNHPSGIAFDAAGHLWVADTGNNRLQEFSSSGAYLGQIGSFGHGDGQFFNPSGVAVDPYGNVWVADTDNNRIQEFALVPEPSSLVLAALCALGLLVRRWSPMPVGIGLSNSIVTEI